MRGKFSFLYLCIWLNKATCKFIVKNNTSIFGYNFVAPLTLFNLANENFV